VNVPARLLRLAPAVLAAALACATGRAARTATPPPQEIAFQEPTVVEARPEDADLATRNDEELFAIGTAAYQAGDPARAAAAFGRIVDAFPASRRVPTALYDAGLAWRQLDRWDLALERFRQLADGYTGPDADEASFFVAEALYRLGRHPEARALLDRLSARADLEPAQHIRALTQRGVVELEDGEPQAAERSLQLALAASQEAERRERLEDYYPAKARFYLGEVYRSYFQALKLAPSASDEAALGKQLEDKAQLLLAAQTHYLRAIRTGDAAWAVAAGARVGELYDALYTQLVEAPLPAGLDEEHARVYRDELRARVRVLVTKAIVAYEETLSAARRAGVENAFVPRAEEALARMRRILADDDARSAGAIVPGSGGR
jgi:tetratricopeptide (TPR) repeat protein